MPTKKAWRFDEDFEKMLASEILNADSFNEKLIAIQFVENLMLFHGFNIGLSNLDLLHRQLSVYHLLRSASAGFFHK